MSMPDDSARAAAQAAGETAGAAALLERLADRIGGKATVRAVFGEPVVSADVTVIPVARVAFGFGGGGGRMPAWQRARGGSGSEPGPAGICEGSGGGGGAEARPLGFIEIRGKEGAARYRPIRDPWTDVVVPLAALAAGLVTPKLASSIARWARR